MCVCRCVIEGGGLPEGAEGGGEEAARKRADETAGRARETAEEEGFYLFIYFTHKITNTLNKSPLSTHYTQSPSISGPILLNELLVYQSALSSITM